ncbi:MAG: hypothetical protein ABDH49_08085 [Candidatus Hydrothermales bacterium]
MRYLIPLVLIFLVFCKKEIKKEKGVPFEIEFAEINSKKPCVNDIVSVNYVLKGETKEAKVIVEWYVNDKKVSEGSEFKLENVKKKDKIYAVLVPFSKGVKGKPYSTEPVYVANSLPVVERAYFNPEVIYSNTEKVKVIPQGYDPDGETIIFFARWRIGNFYPADSSLEISLKNLKEGDTVEAFVYARDNESRSYKSYSLYTLVQNSPPQIYKEDFFIKENKIFVKFFAKDPDNENLSIELISSNVSPLEIKSNELTLVFPYDQKVNELKLDVKISDTKDNYILKSLLLNIKR